MRRNFLLPGGEKFIWGKSYLQRKSIRTGCVPSSSSLTFNFKQTVCEPLPTSVLKETASLMVGAREAVSNF